MPSFIRKCSHATHTLPSVNTLAASDNGTSKKDAPSATPSGYAASALRLRYRDPACPYGKHGSARSCGNLHYHRIALLPENPPSGHSGRCSSSNCRSNYWRQFGLSDWQTFWIAPAAKTWSQSRPNPRSPCSGAVSVPPPR